MKHTIRLISFSNSTQHIEEDDSISSKSFSLSTHTHSNFICCQPFKAKSHLNCDSCYSNLTHLYTTYIFQLKTNMWDRFIFRCSEITRKIKKMNYERQSIVGFLTYSELLNDIFRKKEFKIQKVHWKLQTIFENVTKAILSAATIIIFV